MPSHRMSDHCDLVSELSPTEDTGLCNCNERLTLSLHIGYHLLVVGGKGHKGIMAGIRFLSCVEYHVPPQVF